MLYIGGSCTPSDTIAYTSLRINEVNFDTYFARNSSRIISKWLWKYVKLLELNVAF